jgi:hypothetical protein
MRSKVAGKVCLPAVRSDANIPIMLWKFLAVATLVGACGTVANAPADGGLDAPPGTVMWRNQPGDVPPVTFGGASPGGGMYCNYTITLKQLDVQLSILPSGQVTSGRVQDLNVEAVVPSSPPTTPFVCTATNPMPIVPNIAMYQLATSAATTGGLTLTFQGGASNSPPAALVLVLTKVSSLYSAKLTFHRNDGLDPVFEWMITTTVPLAPQ